MFSDAASFFFTGPATGGVGTVPAYWERPDPNPNDLTPLAGANAISDAIVNAQLTHLISRDDQGATSNQDALMPDASMVRDIATPRTHDWWKIPQVVHQYTACLR